MVDEIYEHIVFSSEGFPSALKTLPHLANRILVVNGVSKAYAMTGWRLGYGAGPAELIQAMAVVQGQATSGACSISQAAARAALNGNQDFLVDRCSSFRERRDMMVSALNQCSGLSCALPDGAFYLFPSCKGVFGQKTPSGTVIETDADFCSFLLEDHGLAVVPGRAFGVPGYFRLSYAYSKDLLEQAATSIRIACGVADLDPNFVASKDASFARTIFSEQDGYADMKKIAVLGLGKVGALAARLLQEVRV